MAAPAHIARENGKKGGRPKGTKSPVTLKVEAAKEELVRMYIEQIRPINQALIDKALTGDIPAIKELHDRVYGRPMQPIEGDFKGELNVIIPKAVAEAFNIDGTNKKTGGSNKK